MTDYFKFIFCRIFKGKMVQCTYVSLDGHQCPTYPRSGDLCSKHRLGPQSSKCMSDGCNKYVHPRVGYCDSHNERKKSMDMINSKIVEVKITPTEKPPEKPVETPKPPLPVTDDDYTSDSHSSYSGESGSCYSYSSYSDDEEDINPYE